MCPWLVIPLSSHFEQTSGSRQNKPIFSTKVVNQNTGFTLSCPFEEQALHENSPVRGNFNWPRACKIKSFFKAVTLRCDL